MAAGPLGANRRLTVVALIDALGWTYIRDSGFLSDLLPYRQPVRTVLGFSSGAIPVMLTGAMPAQTGHWNLFCYDPEHSPFRWLRPFRLLPHTWLDNRYARAVMKRLGRRVLGLGPLFECCVRPSLLPWFDWIEKKNIFAPGGISGAASVFDRLQERRIPYRVYSYRDGSDQTLLRNALRDLRAANARFFFVYLCEMDAYLHGHCSEPENVRERLSWYERQLRELFRAALEEDPQAALTVLSDHGMAPVRKYCDLTAVIESLGLRMPHDYLAVYDSTMARFWFFNGTAKEKITQALAGVPQGRALTDSAMRELGLGFAGRRYGDLVFLLEPGCIVSSGDFNGASWMPAGMHGYHPDDPDSDAIFLSNRKPARPLRSLADVYSCMTQTVFESAEPESAGTGNVHA
jgi:hypothetical protein